MTEHAAEATRPKGKALAPTIGILAALMIIAVIASRIWTDWLWFKALDFSKVFTIRLWTKIGLFAVFGLIGTGLVVGAMSIAYRLRPRVEVINAESAILERYREMLHRRRAIMIWLPALVVGLIAGGAGAGQSETFLAWANQTPFGIKDPYFNTDVAFYVFSLPWWKFVCGQLMTMLIVATIAAGIVHLAMGALGPLRMTRKSTSSANAQRQLSVMLALVLVVYAAQAFLDRYALATNNNGLFTGIGYTEDHIRTGAKLAIAVIALICAALFVANAWLRRWSIPVVGTILMLVSALILNGIYPALVQRFSVEPDKPDKERTYIRNNIAATRHAYDVDDVSVEPYSAVTTAAPGQLKADAEALPGIRLMDPAMIAPTFEQLQQVRGYYAFPNVLDVDRYTIDGKFTDAVVAAREIDLDDLPDKNWNNIHTVYTHGYGLVAAYGNDRQPNGEPRWIVGDIPPKGSLSEHEPRIYYGEQAREFAVVGTMEGRDPVELDTPGGGEEGGNERYNTYEGDGGIPIGNLAVRTAYAIRMGDINLLLSDRVHRGSKIMYDRRPADRVQQVAPWMTVDADPFPAVVDGKLVWILDGYTTSASYPNSQRVDMRAATSEATAELRELQESRPVNYIRNSVKAVVDAYNGDVTLYSWDENDPILQTWMKVYPGTVQPKSEISDDLKQHLRYPQDLFKIQREILGRYHTTSPDTWIQQSDLWVVPSDPRQPKFKESPYYLSIKWPGDDAPVFSETAVYVPNQRENLNAFMSVVADASKDNYGQIRILKLSDSQQIAGPGQTFNAINTDDVVSQKLRPFLNEGSAQASYGNLLTLPVGGGLLYVQPIYTQRQGSTGSYPALRFVAVRFGDHIAIGDTLQEALNLVFKGDAGAQTSETSPEETQPGEPTDQGQSDTVKQLLDSAIASYRQADEALKNGDLAGYQKAVDAARRATERAAAIEAER